MFKKGDDVYSIRSFGNLPIDIVKTKIHDTAVGEFVWICKGKHLAHVRNISLTLEEAKAKFKSMRKEFDRTSEVSFAELRDAINTPTIRIVKW